MIFAHFLIDVNEANSVVVACDETKEALLVDVADWDPRIAAFIETNGLKLSTIFITHDHFDHSGGLADAVRAHDARVYSGSGRAGGQTVTKAGHGDVIRVGKIEGNVVVTPGHTPDSISLIFPGMVFSGDALFSGSVGGTSSAADAKRQIDHIRAHLFSLPEDCEVHTGHGPSSTVGVEKRYNPFFN